MTSEGTSNPAAFEAATEALEQLRAEMTDIVEEAHRLESGVIAMRKRVREKIQIVDVHLAHLVAENEGLHKTLEEKTALLAEKDRRVAALEAEVARLNAKLLERGPQ